MKISGKLILGFVLVALIAAGIGGFAIFNMQRMQAADQKLYRRVAIPLGNLARITESFQRARINLRDLLDAESVSEAAAIRATIDELIKVIDDNSKEYETTLFTDNGRKLYEAFLETRKVYQVEINKAFSLIADGKIEEAKTVVNGSGKAAALAEQKAINDLLDGKVEAGLETTSENTSLARTSALVMVVVLALGAALALVIGIVLSRSITKPLGVAVRLSQEVAAGDLRQDVPEVYTQRVDEIGSLAHALNEMLSSLRRIVESVHSSAGMVSSGSEQMSSTAQEMSQGATEQASSAEEVSSSVEEMGATIRQNADNSSTTETIAQKASVDAEEGGRAVAESVSAMKTIAEKINIIDEIARQTNLLALNAAIEAARAGDAGKGFAVVASEVRKLAERSQTAAAEITELSKSTVESVNKAGELIQRIVPDIKRTAELVMEISASSKEQKVGADQINKAMIQLDQVIQQNASASEEMASMAEELSSQAENLVDTMNFFKMRGLSGMGTPKSETVKRVKVAHAKAAPLSPESETKTGITLAIGSAEGGKTDDSFETF